MELRTTAPDERATLSRLGPDPLIATTTSPESDVFGAATTTERRHPLLGPFLQVRHPGPVGPVGPEARTAGGSIPARRPSSR